MKLGLVIPWRSSPDRLAALDAVLIWYENNYPGIEIFYADRPGEYWQHSASRNDGVRKAQEAHCDVIIINDADTIPERSSLQAAILAAKEDRFIHNPYTICKYLSNEVTRKYLNGEISLQDIPSGVSSKDWDANGINTIWEVNWACGGIFVCQPEAWWDLGGMDEKIIHGPEDLAFQMAHEIIKGTKFIRHPGTIYALSHNQREKITEQDHALEANNIRIYNLYMDANTPEEILKIVKSDA
jgi:hypothetical protein